MYDPGEMKKWAMLLSVWVVSAGSVVGQTAFEQAKKKYEGQCTLFELGFVEARNVQNATYLRTLQSGEAFFQSKGDIEMLLVFKSERERFTTSEKILGDDVVLSPSRLRDIQLAHLKEVSGIRRLTDGKVRELSRLYAGFLEKQKQQLTRTGNLDAATLVLDEQQRMQAIITKPVPTGIIPPRPEMVGLKMPAMGDKPFVPYPRSVLGKLSKQGVSAPVNEIWIYVVDNGMPFSEATVRLVADSTKKIMKQPVDASGRAVFKVDPKEGYRALLLQPGYMIISVRGVHGGDAHRFNLAPYAPGCKGMIKPSYEFDFPELGQVGMSKWHQMGDTSIFGPTFTPTVEGYVFHFPGGERREKRLAASVGYSYVLQWNDIEYELRFEYTGDKEDEVYLEYLKRR